MQPFYSLQFSGQVRRLRRLASDALRQGYDLKVDQLTALSTTHNAVFRADLTTGERVIVRVGAVGKSTTAEVQSEMQWLHRLHHEACLHVPAPIANRRGEFVSTVEVQYVPEPRDCVVLSWVDGREFKAGQTPSMLVKVGVFMGQLHNYAARFTAPPGFTRLQKDRMFPRGVPMALKHAPNRLFSRERQTLFMQAAARVQYAMQQAFDVPEQIHLLHNDLHQDNILFPTRGGACVVDFDDMVWGHATQDIAITLYHLLDHPRFPDLYAAFKQGYESVRAWPETHYGQIDTFIVGRELEMIDDKLRSKHPDVSARLDEAVTRAESRLWLWQESRV